MTITLSDIEKNYDRPLFTNLTIKIQQSDRLLIDGPSGSGKTTLLRIILGLEKPDFGTITGVNHEKCSAVFQEDRLIEHLNGPENILALLPIKNSMATARGALLSLGIPESELQKPVSEWSGGMRRRVSIARALSAGADLVVMDEPFAGLDADTARLCANYILQKLNGATLIVTSHEKTAASLLYDKIKNI